jgi:ABC-2 type transport system permease protein
MNYLLDDKALISVRSRTIQLRKLDEDRVISERSAIQMQNTVLPILLLILFGALQFFMRKRKWTKRSA